MDNETTPSEEISAITVEPTVSAGLPDGHEISGTDGNERIVYDYDEAGNYVGFHKESI